MGQKLQIIDNPWPDKGYWYWWHAEEEERPSAGSCYRCPASDEDDRECWVIILPNDAGPFATTMKTESGYWTVMGPPAEFTITPSILRGADADGKRGWHGFVTNGELVGA